MIFPMVSFHIIYASTSGHTEYVVQLLQEQLKNDTVRFTKQRVELAQGEDLLTGDLLILASGTWNTGGPEGQLNPHMDAFVRGRAKDVNLQGRKVAVIGLGDRRYYFTARALEHLQEFVRTHKGEVVSSLRIVNEPYGQEGAVRRFGKKLLSFLAEPIQRVSINGSMLRQAQHRLSSP